jgi:hypothetical protein
MWAFHDKIREGSAQAEIETRWAQGYRKVVWLPYGSLLIRWMSALVHNADCTVSGSKDKQISDIDQIQHIPP